MNPQLNDLLIQALETEIGGVRVYTTALKCVQNEGLREEWQNYYEQTTRHLDAVWKLCKAFGVNPDAQNSGRQIVHHIGESLVTAMEIARQHGTPQAAELVACDCVLLAETKDHANWQLLAKCAENTNGDAAKTLKAACDEVEGEESERLHQTKGWCRELWIASLGMAAVLPPPKRRSI